MIFGNYSLKKAFKEQEGILTRNIAHDLFQIEFHRTASDDQLALFYGGEVDRDQLLLDTERKLDGDQKLLAYFRSVKNKLIHDYGTKDALADFSGDAQRLSEGAAGSASAGADSGEGSGSEPGQGGEDRLRPEDAAGEGHHDRDAAGDESGGAGEQAEVPHGTGSIDEGGNLRLTLPSESEARRLELERITREVGIIEKTDGDEAVVRPYTK